MLYLSLEMLSNISGIRQAFQKFDVDKDGQIQDRKLCRVCPPLGRSHLNRKLILLILGDKDSNGQIDFSEFAQIRYPVPVTK